MRPAVAFALLGIIFLLVIIAFAGGFARPKTNESVPDAATSALP